MLRSLVGSEMCIRDRYQRRVRGQTTETMSFTRYGGRVITYGRGERGDPDAEETDPNDEYDQALREEIEELSKRNKALQHQIDDLRNQKDNHPNAGQKNDNGLGPEFDFDRRYYQCLIPAPGVGYRNSPSFKDKDPDGCGPQAPQHIIADAIAQGNKAVFVRDHRNKKWLPLTNPSGETVCLAHVGKEGDEAVEALNPEHLAIGRNKLEGKKKGPQDGWFSPDAKKASPDAKKKPTLQLKSP
eukprot:TRINITY_DN2780_c0_g1_i1.p1 TRINITY_DN2780_c0_g1~~TRINITY_DN2780_c0_g1_i1.p1  ORF type:complete len:242 (+),score=81.97 TRINITY_DN2780_c0_g1_i1:126-851(+)